MNAAELNAFLSDGCAAVWSYEERLTAAVREVLDREARAAARRFMQKATSLKAAATVIDETSTMVAVFPTVDQQQQLAQPDGQPEQTIHCTLAFLGDTTVEQFEAICAAIRTTVGLAQPGTLEGMVGGVASFAGGPDGHPSIVLPDVPGLAEMRQTVVDVLLNAGVDVASNHGWTPHLTLAYTETPSPPSEDLLGLPLTFLCVSVVRGDVMRDDIPLSGSLSASGPPEWARPHPDEVVDIDRLTERMTAAIERVRRQSILAFGRKMPGSVKEGGPGTVEPALVASRKAKVVPGQIQLSWDVTSPFVGKTLAQTGAYIGAISRTTRVDVMKAIDDAYLSGLSVRDAADAISGAVAGSAGSRAEMIARTELNRLANGASYNATQVFSDATGVNYHKVWLTAPGAPHPRHELDEGLNGQTVPMEQPFDVNGAQLMYPGDPDGEPGETINCRCTLIYAETGEEVDTDALLAAAGLISPSNPSGGDTMADANETFDDSNMPCDNCDHAMSAHEGDGGACGMDECSCKTYVAPSDNDGDEASVEAVTADGVMAAAQWEAILCPEGKATEDGRVMAPGSISWRELPLSLMAMTETSEGGHVGAELCGRIDSIWKDNGERMTLVNGSGVFDSGETGAEISRLVGDEILRGNSVDLAIREFTIGKRADYVDEEGFWIGPDAPPEEADVDMLDLLFGDGEDLIFVVWDAVIGMSTVCPFPAFEEATITLVAAGEKGARFRMEGDHTALRMRVYSDGAMRLIVDDSLTASAAGLAPEVPPAEWFEDPEFDTPTALTVTDDGRIYGHAWTWDTCHTSFPNRCVTAPHSKTEYALFHLKEVEVDSGDKIACGTITLDAPHASQAASRKEAMAHYEHTGAAVADVRVGEDEHGGWVVGALRPDASAVSVRKLRGAVLSGDWRGWEGNLELIGLLAVNIPGFPVPRRAQAVVASGREGEQVVALLAAGIVTHGSVGEHDKARLLALGARAEGGLAGLAALASSVNGGDCGCES